MQMEEEKSEFVTINRGDRVRIYEDPFTKQRLEGYAKVSRVDATLDNDGLKYCRVRFDGESTPFWRWVDPQDIIRRESQCSS